jgi:hypothetical protein
MLAAASGVEDGCDEALRPGKWPCVDAGVLVAAAGDCLGIVLPPDVFGRGDAIMPARPGVACFGVETDREGVGVVIVQDVMFAITCLVLTSESFT